MPVTLAGPQQVSVFYAGPRQADDARHEPIAMGASLLRTMEITGVGHDHDRVALDTQAA